MNPINYGHCVGFRCMRPLTFPTSDQPAEAPCPRLANGSQRHGVRLARRLVDGRAPAVQGALLRACRAPISSK